MLEWILPPLVGALVGWSTNALALWSLFRPRRPWRLGPWTLQGVLPRRREALAEAVAEAVARELLTQADLRDRLLAPEVQERLGAALVEAAGRLVGRWLPGFLPASLRAAVVEGVTSAVRAEAGRLVAKHLPAAVDGLLAALDVREAVRRRLLALDLEALEALVRRVAGAELRYVVHAGGVLGFLVGLAQAAVLALLR